MSLKKNIKHLRDREYMSGVERDKLRTKATGEVFTPTPLVQEILDKLPSEVFEDLTKTFCDPSCGDGQFLSEVLIRKLENGIDFETALSTIYGVDLMSDNVQLCRDRLLCGREELRSIVTRNIVCHDALTYDYSFNGTDFTDAELLEQKLGLPAKVAKTKRPAKPKKSAQIASAAESLLN
jgi:type I restriction-modification system DNA methylase subunit